MLSQRAPAVWRLRTLVSKHRLNLGQRTIQSETASFNPHAQRKAHSWASPAKIILGIIPLFTFGLGTWQIQRLRWKVGLIEELEDKLGRDPMALPKQINLSALSDFEYRRVVITGTWDDEHSILVGPRTRDNVVGYQLVTPFKRTNGSTIIVDRGFVSGEQAQNARNRKSAEGEVEVTGMLRTKPQKNSFTPDNKPEKGEWYWTDVEGVVSYAGGTRNNVQPVLVEAVFDGHAGQALSNIKHGVPVGRPSTVEIRNEHRTYAVTWYSLSAATAVMFWRLVRRGRG